MKVLIKEIIPHSKATKKLLVIVKKTYYYSAVA